MAGSSIEAWECDLRDRLAVVVNSVAVEFPYAVSRGPRTGTPDTRLKPEALPGHVDTRRAPARGRRRPCPCERTWMNLGFETLWEGRARPTRTRSNLRKRSHWSSIAMEFLAGSGLRRRTAGRGASADASTRLCSRWTGTRSIRPDSAPASRTLPRFRRPTPRERMRGTTSPRPGAQPS